MRPAKPAALSKRPYKRRNALNGRLARGGWGGGSRFLSATRGRLFLPRMGESCSRKAKARLGRAFAEQRGSLELRGHVSVDVLVEAPGTRAGIAAPRAVLE